MELVLFLGACLLVAFASMLMLRHERLERAKHEERQTLDTRGPDDR